MRTMGRKILPQIGADASFFSAPALRRFCNLAQAARGQLDTVLAFRWINEAPHPCPAHEPLFRIKSLKVLETLGAKWLNARPHPGPLPRGEGEPVSASWRWRDAGFASGSGVQCAKFFREFSPHFAHRGLRKTRRGRNAPSFSPWQCRISLRIVSRYTRQREV